MDDQISSGDTTLRLTTHLGIDVVSIVGDVDLCNQSRIMRFVCGTAPVTQQQVILDLSQVSFLDASGIGALIYCRRVLAARTGHLVLVCPEGLVLRVLLLLGMQSVLPIYPNLADALSRVLSSNPQTCAIPA